MAVVVPSAAVVARRVAPMATERTPSTASVYIAPPPTGRTSVSFSSWRAVPEVLTRLGQPETAPQAIVTNRIGQIGPRCGWNAVTNHGIANEVAGTAPPPSAIP